MLKEMYVDINVDPNFCKRVGELFTSQVMKHWNWYLLTQVFRSHTSPGYFKVVRAVLAKTVVYKHIKFLLAPIV